MNFRLLKYEHKMEVLLELFIIEIIFLQSKFSQSYWTNFEKIKFSFFSFAQLLDVFFKSVFIQSVFLRNVPDLRVFEALQIYFWPYLGFCPNFLYCPNWAPMGSPKRLIYALTIYRMLADTPMSSSSGFKQMIISSPEKCVQKNHVWQEAVDCTGCFF